MRSIARFFLGCALIALCADPAGAQQQSPKKTFIFRDLPHPSLFLKGTTIREMPKRVDTPQSVQLGASLQLSGNDAKYLGKKEKYAVTAMPGVSQSIQKLVAVQLAWARIRDYNGKSKQQDISVRQLIATVDAAAITSVQAALDRGVIKAQAAKAALATVLYKVAIAKPELKDQILLGLKNMAKMIYKRGDGYQLLSWVAAKRLMDPSAASQFNLDFFAAQRPGSDYKHMLLTYKGVLDAATTNAKLGALGSVDVMKR